MIPPGSDELLALIAANPTDLATLLVYADYFEEQADLDRARFLRLEHRLRAAVAPLTASHLTLAETIRKLGERIEARPDQAAWIEAVSTPRIRGTTWVGNSGVSEFTGRFLDDGALNYTQSSGTFQNGTWKQYGSVVLFEMNRHYAEYLGVILQGAIVGKAKNVSKSTWDWRLEPTAVVVEVPADTNHTIYPYTPPATRTKAKRKRKRAPAAVPTTSKPAAKLSRPAAKRQGKPAKSATKQGKPKPGKPTIKPSGAKRDPAPPTRRAKPRAKPTR
ncbi:MAG: TIGR02996 domain-containing protein [Proteobacteria bacterium]|nr:TIGR02996 domain-containing protein [Pseudomonadota bacterium]